MTHIIAYMIVAVIYFIPTIIVLYRGCEDIFFVVMINVLFGWLVIGWLVSLALAFCADDRAHS